MVSLGEIASGLTIFDWGRKLFTWFTTFLSKKDQQEQSVADRFILLFEKHGVHRSQIPRFFGHGLTIEDTSSSEKLLSKLSHDILQAACDLFRVRLEWLEGADNQIYSIRHFYKHPEQFKTFLQALSKEEGSRLTLKLVVSPNAYNDNDALMIIEEPIRELGEREVKRYHICGGWSYRYYKCRADIAACFAIALKQKVYVPAVKEVKADISAYCGGYMFVSDLYDLPSYYRRQKLTLFKKDYDLWYPDDWLDNPVMFTEGLRDGEWGKTQAIKRWLYYHEQGYLETGYNDVSREAFTKHLEKFQEK